MTKSAKQYFDTALEMKHAATGEYRKLAEKARAEISAAKGDADLSPQGREKKAEQLKRKHGVEIMKWAHSYRQMVQSEMKKARIAAQKELDKAAPKVDPTKLERWEKEYRKVKTSLMLASSVDKAAKVMNDFIKTADDPGLKALLVDRYGDLAEQVLSVGSDPNVRAQMADQFNSLQNEALTDAQVEARQVLEATEGFEQRNVFDKLVADNLTGLVGWEYGDYINDTDTFFSREGNAEHKPDDYVHPEEVERQQRISDYKAEQEKWDRIFAEKRARGEMPKGGK